MADLDKTPIVEGADIEASYVSDLYDALTRTTRYDNVPLFPQQVVTVAKAGGQYTTIQGAIDSITDAASDKIYTVLVYPGEYDEAITLSNYIDIVAINPENTKILQTVTDDEVECHCYINITIESYVLFGLQILDSLSVIKFVGNISSTANAAVYIKAGTVDLIGNFISTVSSGISIYGDATVNIIGDITSSGVGITTRDYGSIVTFSGNIVSQDHSISAGINSILTVKNSTLISYLSGESGIEIKGTATIINSYIYSMADDTDSNTIYITAGSLLKLINSILVATHSSANCIVTQYPVNLDIYCMNVWANRTYTGYVIQKITNGFNYDIDVQ